MNKKLHVYNWWTIRDNNYFLFKNNILYLIKFKKWEVKWKVWEKQIDEAIMNSTFYFKEELKEEFITKFKSELMEIKNFYTSHKEHILDKVSYKYFYSLKKEKLKEFLFFKSWYFNYNFIPLVNNKKILNFLKWKENYFNFNWYLKEYEEEIVFWKESLKLFNIYYSWIPENVILLGSQIKKYRNRNNNIEKIKEKYNISSISKKFKKIENRKKRRLYKVNILNFDTDKIYVPKFKRDNWFYI